jgi:hypothetical protein
MKEGINVRINLQEKLCQEINWLWAGNGKVSYVGWDLVS